MISNKKLAKWFGYLVLLWVSILAVGAFIIQGESLPTIRSMTIASLPAGIWNGKHALADIVTQVSFGNRASGTAGHDKTIAFIRAELAKTAAKVTVQSWEENGKTYTNIFARFAPENPRRILIATHYDSITRAYRDKDTPDAIMPGANNSASGVALLLETARALGSLPSTTSGVDMAFFDGEEGAISLGEGDEHWKPIGSPYFAQHISQWYPGSLPEVGLVFDMVCYKKLLLKPERFSIHSARLEVAKLWYIGNATAPSLFTTETASSPIGDDHLALHKIGIPSVLLIGFEYEPWYNTTQDTPDKCSSESLEGVGVTLLRYIYSR